MNNDEISSPLYDDGDMMDIDTENVSEKKRRHLKSGEEMKRQQMSSNKEDGMMELEEEEGQAENDKSVS